MYSWDQIEINQYLLKYKIQKKIIMITCFRIIILLKSIFHFWYNSLFKVNRIVDWYFAGIEKILIHLTTCRDAVHIHEALVHVWLSRHDYKILMHLTTCRDAAHIHKDLVHV